MGSAEEGVNQFLTRDLTRFRGIRLKSGTQGVATALTNDAPLEQETLVIESLQMLEAGKKHELTLVLS